MDAAVEDAFARYGIAEALIWNAVEAPDRVLPATPGGAGGRTPGMVHGPGPAWLSHLYPPQVRPILLEHLFPNRALDAAGRNPVGVEPLGKDMLGYAELAVVRRAVAGPWCVSADHAPAQPRQELVALRRLGRQALLRSGFSARNRAIPSGFVEGARHSGRRRPVWPRLTRRT